MDYEVLAKGFLKTLAEYGDIMSEKTKLQTDVIANEFKSSRNFFWKMKEQEAERQNKLKFIQEFTKQQGGQDNQENRDMNIDTPQMRIGAGGELGLNYPSARDKEFNIKLGLNQISKMEAAGKTLSPTQQAFKDKYEGLNLGGKTKTENQPFAINEGVQIPEGYERVGFDSKGNPMIRKIKSEKEIDKNKITPSQALNIISDPFKSQQLKRYYPELYKKIETIAKQEEIQVTNTETPTSSQEQILPNGITEEDIQHTLKLHPEYTREQLLKKLGAQ